MNVEIWSDIVCPWCYIGKRRFETALSQFEHRDQVEVIWKSFQLNPHAPRHSGVSLYDALAQKYGMSVSLAKTMTERVSKLAAAEGLDYHFEKAQDANTFDAHRLLHFAVTQGKQDEMKERLMKAYFTEGAAVDDVETLVRLAAEVGLNADEARTVLESNAYAIDVKADIQRARVLGIEGVPFFVIDGKYGISGAQPAELFKSALEQAWAESHPLIRVGGASQDAGSCEGDACEL